MPGIVLIREIIISVFLHIFIFRTKSTYIKIVLTEAKEITTWPVKCEREDDEKDIAIDRPIDHLHLFYFKELYSMSNLLIKVYKQNSLQGAGFR